MFVKAVTVAVLAWSSAAVAKRRLQEGAREADLNFSDEHPSLLELTESSGTQLVPLRGAALATEPHQVPFTLPLTRRSRASARMMAPAGGKPDSEAARKQLVEKAEKQKQQFFERREASRSKQKQHAYGGGTGEKAKDAEAPEDEPAEASGRAWEQGWTTKAAAGTKQDFLEADPYYSRDAVPVNTYKAKAPYTAKIVSVNRMVGPEATGETCHIIIDHGGNMPYYEGQSYGVIAPVTDPRTGKPAKTRLYSIASSRYGDDMSGNTASLCVRRATYWCPEMQAEDPAKKGVCSNFLCDAKPGDEVQLTGPSGKVMLMPEEDPNTDLIMIATGTGIAPYRGFIRRNFLENTPACEKYGGLAWLFLGVANSDGLLYDDEFQQVLKENPNNFRVDYALSREGDKKMYIQDKVAEYGAEIFDRMDKGAHLYMCGLKGMLPGVTETLQGIAESKGEKWNDVLSKWKKGGQWHIEVY